MMYLFDLSYFLRSDLFPDLSKDWFFKNLTSERKSTSTQLNLITNLNMKVKKKSFIPSEAE